MGLNVLSVDVNLSLDRSLLSIQEISCVLKSLEGNNQVRLNSNMMLVLLLHKDHLCSLEVIDMISSFSVCYVSLDIVHWSEVVVNLSWVLDLVITSPFINLFHSLRHVGLSLLHVSVMVIEFIIVSVSIGICD